MTADRDRIAALEAENAKLAARIRELDPPPPAPEVDGEFCPPTAEQARRLFAIVADAHPQLSRSRELADDRTLHNFARAFFFVGHSFRTREVNTRASLDYWTTEGAIFLRRQGINSDFTAGAFAVACAAHGDVDHLDFGLWPDSYGFALDIGEPQGARRPRNAWLTVLRTGRLRPATPMQDRIKAPRVADIRIYGGDRGRTVGSEWG